MEHKTLFKEFGDYLLDSGISIKDSDLQKPWGGFFVIEEDDTKKFIGLFFSELREEDLSSGKLSPKILFIAPGKKLSWQYHYRRAEVWKLLQGKTSLIRSDTDTENLPVFLNKGDIVILKQGERHRLVGSDIWAVVAEIWMHTDENYPSDESDIVRIQDDFGR